MEDLKRDTENTPKDEVDKMIKLCKTLKVLDLVELILHFNEENQKGGLKILTPSQMLHRLPISLAQLKARNNSEKLKNEIRQLLHSLSRSKKLTKTIYNHLISTI